MIVASSPLDQSRDFVRQFDLFQIVVDRRRTERVGVYEVTGRNEVVLYIGEVKGAW